MSSTFTPHDLEKIAGLALKAARLLTECGARSKVVNEGIRHVVEGLGATCVGTRTGYASVAVTLSAPGGEPTVTRVATIERYGVNHRLDMAVRHLIAQVAEKKLTAAAFESALEAALPANRRHPAWFVALAVGLACACFGRLFGVDWSAFAPVLIAGSIGQYTRHLLVMKKLNPFVVAAFIALMDALLAGLGARFMGSGTVNLAMMASILLLVPGVPATNAQMDIMDGYPTLGSARAVTVLMIMIFAASGVWVAQSLLGVR